MSGGCDDCSRMSRLDRAHPGRHPLRQMHAGAAHADSISANQQNHTPSPRDPAQPSGHLGGVRGPERAVCQASPARQSERESHGFGRALGIREKDRERQSARKGLPARGCAA